MSFKCRLCGFTSKPGERATRIVTETREKIYPVRPEVYTYMDTKTGKEIVKDDPGGKGFETVKEILACIRCV